MKRVLLTTCLVAALASSAWAGDLAQAAAPAEPRTAQTTGASRWFSTTEVWVGAAMMAGGVAMAFYGFGHPTGPVDQAVILTQPESFSHNRGLGFAGIVVAAAGGVVAWHGVAHVTIQAGPRRLVVQRRVSF